MSSSAFTFHSGKIHGYLSNVTKMYKYAFTFHSGKIHGLSTTTATSCRVMFTFHSGKIHGMFDSLEIDNDLSLHSTLVRFMVN